MQPPTQELQRQTSAMVQQACVEMVEAFMARGWDECLEVLDRVDAALVASDRNADPCLATSEGWVAEEAFAAGLLCFLLYPEEPVQALRRAAVTEGDSDSIFLIKPLALAGVTMQYS